MSEPEARFRWGAATDTGRVRSNNQDTYLATDSVFVVADGMGGHQGGEVAAQIAVEGLADSVAEATTPALLEGVRRANRSIVEAADRDSDLRGMGTTLCLVAPVDTEVGRRLAVVNVGDSRVYRYAADRLRQVTEDHSLVESLVREGRLTPEEALVHPQRNILTRALGVGDELQLDWWELAVRPGDRYVLCSDGLFNELGDDQIAATLRRLAQPDEAADELVRLALESGGRDNVTVIVVDVVGGDDDKGGDDEPDDGDIPAPEVAHFADRDDDDDSGGEPPDGGGSSRDRRFRWRVVGYLALVAVILVVAAGAVGVYARSNYFVDVDGDEIVILQGRPGGVLWFDPTLEEVTALAVGDLTPALKEEVEANPEYASLDGARGYVEALAERIEPIPEPTAID